LDRLFFLNSLYWLLCFRLLFALFGFGCRCKLGENVVFFRVKVRLDFLWSSCALRRTGLLLEFLE
jgi:hypothetical protein